MFTKASLARLFGNKNPVHIFLDGDIYCYQAASEAEYYAPIADDFYSMRFDAQRIYATLEDHIKSICALFHTDKITIALSNYPSTNCFRKLICPTYKSNRKGRKPYGVTFAREYLRNNFNVIELFGLEGDDVLGLQPPCSLTTNPTGVEQYNNVNVTIDKDMRTIPGFLFLEHRAAEGVIKVFEYEANYYWMYQTLVGDATDGYTGCPGVGPIAAKKALEGVMTLEEMWASVVSVYKRAGLPEEEAVLQARLSRILRPGDYDYETHTVHLWEPDFSRKE